MSMTLETTFPPRLPGRAFIATRLLLLLAIISTGCAGVPKPRPSNVVSLDPQDWEINRSPGMPLHPSKSSEGAWSIGLPTSTSDEYISAAQTPFTAASIPRSMRITFKIESDSAQYEALDSPGQSPAVLRVFFEKQNADPRNPNGRWWATTSNYNLGSLDGQVLTFNIPLTPGQWMNANGEQDNEAFFAALGNIGSIGIAFGGESTSARGVALKSGDAQFILIDFNID